MPNGFHPPRAGEMEYLTIPQFDAAGVKHCFSTRLGGVSEGGCRSLNLGLNRGESRETVLKNYEILCGALGLSTQSLVLSAQTHTDNIRRVGRADVGAGIYREGFCDVDGLSTDEPGVTLVTFYADCTPLFFYDPVKRVCALPIRAGAVRCSVSAQRWRSTCRRSTVPARGYSRRGRSGRRSVLL